MATLPLKTGLLSRARQLLPALLLCCACATSPLKAQESEAQAPEIDPDIFFVLGNLEYILLHELAHLLIADLDIPVIGSEESAADYIATATLIRADLFDADRADRARQFLFATANGLATSWDFRSNSDSDIQFWGSHALTIQRFYQMICLIYGSNPTEFAQLPRRVDMPAARSALCANEFARAERSLQWLLANYGRQPDDPPGAAIDVVIDRAPTRVSRRIAEALSADGMLDRMAEQVTAQFTIREPFTIAIRRCREPQANWLPEEREIRVCFALLDAYYAMGLSGTATRRRSDLTEN